jgi:pimeloyl-ACP methyl ester carboxylesterase
MIGSTVRRSRDIARNRQRAGADPLSLGAVTDGPRSAVVGGRRVAYSEHGDPAGAPVFFLHGVPDSRVGKEYLGRPAVERGLRVVCPDRPGIGGSEPRPGRTVAGYAAEVLGLADALRVDRFAVVGYSGGGPYALSCAAGCGPRLTAVALMAGTGPLDDRPGARVGLAPGDLHLLDQALHHPGRGALALRAERLVARLAPGPVLRRLAGELAGPDRAVLDATGPAVLAAFVEALRPGPAGTLEDYRLWASPWGLDWSAVGVPVEVFLGDLDRVVPMHHAEDVVARLPAGLGRLHRLVGEGHLSILGRVGEVLDALGTP